MDTIQIFNFTKSKEELNKNYRSAGLIHKKIYKRIIDKLQPNMKLMDLSQIVENLIKEEVKFVDSHEKRLDRGIGFPVGLSINECAAHWTPNPMDLKETLGEHDLIKIDYGVHIQGCIVDGAYSFSFDNKFDPLIKVAEEATSMAIRESGVDAVLGDIGHVVQEYIESQEIELDGDIKPLKSFKDLTGHKIAPWIIHADKCVPNFKIDYPVRMEEGEIYAIETFPSTGKGRGIEQLECSHYQVNTDLLIKEYRELNNINCQTGGKILNPIILDKKEKYVYDRILDLYQTLPFCKKWLKEEKINKYHIPLRNLVKKQRIRAFPPINDIKGSYVAQSEKTIMINSEKVEILN
jgi:methionyl aminopeptidase